MSLSRRSIRLNVPFLWLILSTSLAFPSLAAPSPQPGTIVTLAGASLPPGSGSSYLGGFSGDKGPATAALLNSPQNVAVDASGNIHASDVENQRIRKIRPDGAIATVAGPDPAAGLDARGDGGPAAAQSNIGRPAGLAVDPAASFSPTCPTDASERSIRTGSSPPSRERDSTTARASDTPGTAARP